MTHEEALQFLKDFITKVDAQDNRATARPIQYLLQVERVVWGRELNNPDFTKYALPEFDYYGHDSVEELIQQMRDNDWTDKEIEAERDNIVSYQGETWWDTEQAFLTEAGVAEHIMLNKHNLGRHRDWVVHAFRNPELFQLYAAIRAVIGEQSGT